MIRHIFHLCVSAVLLGTLAGCASANLDSRALTSSALQTMDTASPTQGDLPAVRIVDHRTKLGASHFARFSQCQIEVSLASKPNDQGVWEASESENLLSSVRACVKTAVRENVDVLILPELALSMPDNLRNGLIDELKTTTKSERMIIVAGSHYDDSRFNRLIVVGPEWTEAGYKVRPSRFEASPLANDGMKPGPEVLVIKSDFGTLAIITCVDLISDEIQFIVRRLATRGEIDVLINVNHNPSSWEFLIEANSIVRRHPLFASITNVFVPAEKVSRECLKDGKPKDIGYCYGHTSVFASLRTSPNDSPNSTYRLLKTLPEPIVNLSPDGEPVGISLPYSNVVADVGAFREGLLVYELNMLLKREPNATNAPDQGYPTIRGVKIVDLVR